jgi:hypothetical protein
VRYPDDKICYLDDELSFIFTLANYVGYV